ncbi:MAG: transporter substrate-binding domain-containing protein, partial [bacterium]
KLIAVTLALMLALAGVSAMADELTMATNCAFPPYEFYDDVTGEPTGIDVEIVTRVFERMGHTVTVEDMDFGSVITSVHAGKYTIGAGAITITEERKNSVLFTDPYEITVQQILVPEGSAITAAGDIEVEGAGYSIGVQQDTTGDLYVSELEQKGCVKVERFKTGTDAVIAMTSGKVDAVVIDNGPALAYVTKYPGLTMIASACDSEEYGFCFAKENAELCEAFNAELNAMIEDGTVNEIIAKYNAMMEE